MGNPDDLAWLQPLVRRSPLLADARSRRHWTMLLGWLDTRERYMLAAALLDIEHGLANYAPS